LQPGHRWGRLQSSPDPIARFKGGGALRIGEGKAEWRGQKGRGEGREGGEEWRGN